MLAVPMEMPIFEIKIPLVVIFRTVATIDGFPVVGKVSKFLLTAILRVEILLIAPGNGNFQVFGDNPSQSLKIGLVVFASPFLPSAPGLHDLISLDDARKVGKEELGVEFLVRNGCVYHGKLIGILWLL